MLVLLMGHKLLDFVSDGNVVKGIQAFVAYPENGVIGQRTDKLFFRDGFPLPELQPGMTLDISFNNRGKPDKVEIASEPRKLNITK